MAIPVSPVLYVPDTPPLIDRAEVLRYLGYGTHEPDTTTAALLERCACELSEAVRPRIVYAAFPITVQEEGVRLDGCGLLLPGRDIAAHLKNCRFAVLLAATLSAQGDQMIRRAQARDVAAGLVMDCCATAAVEQFCDDFEEVVKQQVPNAFFTTRYSPGYGDLPLDIQREFLAVLDAPRKIGLCATDSSILTPRKSVTAILGVGDLPAAPAMTGCDHCLLRDNCAFRKRGEYCGLSKSSK